MRMRNALKKSHPTALKGMVSDQQTPGLPGPERESRLPAGRGSDPSQGSLPPELSGGLPGAAARTAPRAPSSASLRILPSEQSRAGRP